MNHHVLVADARPHTREFDENARSRLGVAVARAREKAGYSRPRFLAMAGIGRTSLFKLESGVAVSAEVYEKVARALPGWTEDTPRVILEGGPAPSLPDALARIDSTTVGVPQLPAIFQADDATLMAIIEDRDKIGTNEWLEVLGILLADDKITKEAYVHALTVGRKVRQARKEAEQKIADLQQSLTERVRAELSE